jgi:hypothetical protein
MTNETLHANGSSGLMSIFPLLKLMLGGAVLITHSLLMSVRIEV